MPTAPVLDTAFLRHRPDLATDAVRRESPCLTGPDSPTGDADHGSTMDRGFTAASIAVRKEPPESPGATSPALLPACLRDAAEARPGSAGQPDQPGRPDQPEEQR